MGLAAGSIWAEDALTHDSILSQAENNWGDWLRGQKVIGLE